MSEYEIKQKAAGFKIGDRVKVVRIAQSHEDGWNNDWVADEMNRCVGEEFEIRRIWNDKGISLGGYNFPFFVLERVESPEEKIKRISEKFERLISRLENDGYPLIAETATVVYKKFLETHKLSIEEIEDLNRMWGWALNAYAKNK